MLIESELRELLGIPNEARFDVMIPMGWPRGEFVKVKAETDRKSHTLRKMEQYLAVTGNGPKTLRLCRLYKGKVVLVWTDA